MQTVVSRATLKRLPLYLHYLKSLDKSNSENISATAIAKTLGFGEVQVRKDLASVSGAGKPRTGYVITDLIRHLESFLGYDNISIAVIVGAGKLGKALLDYEGFSEYGLKISTAFDIDKEKTGITEKGKQILSMEEFSDYCKKENVKLGIITVPAPHAQSVCSIMIENNISAIWNFAPTHLKAPENVIIYNENMALSLAMLSEQLKH
ncbi:MAG: redox-sensing transcriptional repressor Rex [Clostridia bacterium]|nr:redox-sensing transcriptional repressor Rex [Clostridia bacterium]